MVAWMLSFQYHLTQRRNEMTTQIKQVERELIHTADMLVKFCCYSEQFRDYDLINDYRRHVRKLLNMLGK